MLKLTLVEQHFEINVLQVKEFGFERGIYKQIRVSNLAQGPHSSGDVFYQMFLFYFILFWYGMSSDDFRDRLSSDDFENYYN